MENIEPENLLPILKELKEKRPDFYREWVEQTVKVHSKIIDDADNKKPS